MEKILPLCRPESEIQILPKYVGKRSFDKRTNMPRATKNRVNFHDYLPDAKRIAEKTYTNAEGVAHKVAVKILLSHKEKGFSELKDVDRQCGLGMPGYWQHSLGH